MNVPERLLADERLERLYRALVDEEDARVCRDIDEQACRVVPGNFFLQLLTQFLTRLGDAIAKTLLAWLAIAAMFALQSWIAGSASALATVLPTAGVIVILAGMGLAGAALSARLPEVT